MNLNGYLAKNLIAYDSEEAKDFDFDLPKELIAQYPSAERGKAGRRGAAA